MREIKFRGKSKTDGSWVYGSLILSSKSKDGFKQAWILPQTILPLGALSTPTSRFIEVFTDSVSEYTGRADENGKEIYEGDNLKSNSTDFIYPVCYDVNHAGFVTISNRAELSPNNWKHSQIIDNINENKELLKG